MDHIRMNTLYDEETQDMLYQVTLILIIDVRAWNT